MCKASEDVPPFWYGEGWRPVLWNHSVVGPAHKLAGSNCDGNRWWGLGALGCYWRVMAMVLVEIDLPTDRLVDWLKDVRRLTANVQDGCLPSLLGYTMRFGG